MWRLLVLAIVFLYFMYYLTLMVQFLHIISITNRKITFARCLIPFYYWIAPMNEREKPEVIRPKSISDIVREVEDKRFKN